MTAMYIIYIYLSRVVTIYEYNKVLNDTEENGFIWNILSSG